MCIRDSTQPVLASLFVKIPGDKGKQGHVKGVVGHQSPDVQITVIEMPVHHKKHAQGRQDAKLHIDPRTGLPLDVYKRQDIDKGVIRALEKEGISQIQVNVQDTYNRTQCYMDEFTLKVKRDSGRSRGNEAPRIEILIPAGYGLVKLSLDLGAAECTVLGVTVSKLEIDTGVGAITFSGTVNGDVEIETGVGDVTLNLTGSQDGYNYQVECGVGSIDVGAEHYSMLSHETHINNKAPYTMELECGVGNIAVNFDQIL